MSDFETILIDHEEISPKEFLRRYPKKRDPNIERVHIMPPAVGERGFGRVRIEYRDPIYTVIGHKPSKSLNRLKRK